MPDAAVASTTAAPDRPTLTPAKRRRQIQFAHELLGTPPEWIIGLKQKNFLVSNFYIIMFSRPKIPGWTRIR